MNVLIGFVILLSPAVLFVACASALSTANQQLQRSHRFVLLGGAGRIGTAVASHLLLQKPKSQIILVGRQENMGQKAVQEVLGEHPGKSVEFQQVDDIWERSDALQSILQSADCVIHTAGPYMERKPLPLQMAIESKCKVYVDVADPLPYLETACLMNHAATEAGITALLSAGAFPGMSNVLAMEAAATLGERVQDVRFQYFTAGLGGSGSLNLYITNLGFGEPMAQYDAGELRFFMALSGLLLGTVDFFLPDDSHGFGNEEARRRVGRQQVFAWPFPEAATVATELNARGNSLACMGTAPDFWNTMLGVLVQLVPRPWWRSAEFSKFLADFSEPLVRLTDQLMKLTDPGGVGETHAMRVDVNARGGPTVSIVQAHDSFRRCVAQSCAEFALDCLERPQPGVFLPEQRYRDPSVRKDMIDRLTSTPGTFCYSGPVRLDEAAPPTDINRALIEAAMAETSNSMY